MPRTRNLSRSFARGLLALLAALGLYVSPARAASDGELCGRGVGFALRCDPGLRCEARFRLGSLQLGLCAPARQRCGGLVPGATCPSGQYCDYPVGAFCGAADQTGVCRTQPSVCTKEYRPVCGCDDETYGNRCMAAAAGVSVAREGACGECQTDEECPHGSCDQGVSCAGLDCPPPPPSRCSVCGDGSALRCRRALEPCPEGQVREIVEGCYGACVERDSCEPTVCEYNGKSYQVGDSFPDADGCNTCGCDESGQVYCTLRLCACDYSDPRRTWVERDAEVCTRIDFLCADGERQFSDRCGCGCERPGSTS